MTPIDRAARVRALVRDQAGEAWLPDRLGDDLPLGSGGVGLDSVALVELILACERDFGVWLGADVLEGDPLTVGRLVRLVSHAAARDC